MTAYGGTFVEIPATTVVTVSNAATKFPGIAYSSTVIIISIPPPPILVNAYNIAGTFNPPDPKTTSGQLWPRY